MALSIKRREGERKSGLTPNAYKNDTESGHINLLKRAKALGDYLIVEG